MPPAAQGHATKKTLAAGSFLALAVAFLALAMHGDEAPPSPPPATPPATQPAVDTAPATAPVQTEPARDTTSAPPSPPAPGHGTIEVMLDPGDHPIQGVQCTARDLTGVAASSRVPAVAGVGPFRITLFVPTERWLVVTAELLPPPGSPPGAIVFGPRLRLGPGEVRRIELRVEGPSTTLRVTGPSPPLLAHLTAAITTLGSPPRQFEAPLQPDGSLLCHLPAEPVRAHLPLANDTPCPLQTDAGTFDLIGRGGMLLLHPLQPLVGLVLGAPGREQPAALAFDKLAPRDRQRTCTVVTAAEASTAEVVHGWTAALGAFTAPVEHLQRHGDVLYLDPIRTTRQASLTVELLPVATPTSAMDLLVEALDGSQSGPLEREGERRRGILAPGDYRLVWHLRDQRGAIAHEHLMLTAGATVTLRLQPPTAQRWTMRLRDVPPERAHRLFLAIGKAASLGSANAGAFTIDLLEPPLENCAAELFSPVLQCRFPARLNRIDTATRQAEIDSPAAAAPWSRILGLPFGTGPVFVRLLSPADVANPARDTNLLESPVELPLSPATERRGCTMERIDGRLQLIGWFRLADGTRELPVEPYGLWKTLRLERPLVRARVFASGDDDLTTELFPIDRTGDFPLFVAAGTRAFHLDLEPGGRITLPVDGPLLVR